MKSYVIVHISDLHIGSVAPSHLDVLHAAVRDEVDNDSRKRYLVVTGDLVDSPSRRNLEQATTFLRQLQKEGGFEAALVVRGNHDAKRVMGNAWMSRRFDRALGSVEAVDGDGVRLIGVDSNGGLFARGRVSDTEYNRLVVSMTGGARREGYRPIRIVALHHHPLPLASGEGLRELGVADEGFMYLEQPAKFLEACVSAGVPLVLHGHRHVTGCVRYSVPTRRVGSDIHDIWHSIYVLSCPSSTGRSGGVAGFNVIRPAGRFLTVARLQRQGKGPFEVIDKNLPDGALWLELSAESIVESDPAFRIARDILHASMTGPVPELRLYDFVTQLFARPTFTRTESDSPGELLYAVSVTHYVWSNILIPRLRPQRQQDAQTVGVLLAQMQQELGSAMGLSRGEVTSLQARFLYDVSAFKEHMPAHVVAASDVREIKTRSLAQVRAALSTMGVVGTILQGRGASADIDAQPLPVSGAVANGLWARFVYYLHEIENADLEENWSSNVVPIANALEDRLKDGDRSTLAKVVGALSSSSTVVSWWAFRLMSRVISNGTPPEVREALVALGNTGDRHCRFYARLLTHLIDPVRWPKADLESLYDHDGAEVFDVVNIRGRYLPTPVRGGQMRDIPFAEVYARFANDDLP